MILVAVAHVAFQTLGEGRRETLVVTRLKDIPDAPGERCSPFAKSTGTGTRPHQHCSQSLLLTACLATFRVRSVTETVLEHLNQLDLAAADCAWTPLRRQHGEIDQA